MLTDTWLDNRPIDSITADRMDNFTFGFSQLNQGSFSVREVRLVTDWEGFLKQNAKPADLVYEFEYDEIEIIPAEDFAYIKDNDINMHITILDGYPIYEWHFKGSEVKKPADFDPTILFDDDIVKISKEHKLAKLLKEDIARAFMLNSMPGKATLLVNTDLKYDFETELYLYQYDAKTGESEKVSKDAYIVNEADMVEMTAEKAGIYYLVPTDVKIGGEATRKEGGMTPLQIALSVIGAAAVVGGLGTGAVFFVKKRKKGKIQ